MIFFSSPVSTRLGYHHTLHTYFSLFSVDTMPMWHIWHKKNLFSPLERIGQPSLVPSASEILAPSLWNPTCATVHAHNYYGYWFVSWTVYIFIFLWYSFASVKISLINSLTYLLGLCPALNCMTTTMQNDNLSNQCTPTHSLVQPADWYRCTTPEGWRLG